MLQCFFCFTRFVCHNKKKLRCVIFRKILSPIYPHASAQSSLVFFPFSPPINVGVVLEGEEEKDMRLERALA